MFESALQVAVDSNNIGVSLLVKLRHQEALEVFRAAADLMYTVTQEVKNNLTQEGTSSSSDPKSALKVERVQQQIREIEETANQKRRRISATKAESDCFLHDEGFILNLAPENQFSCALESATILLNMALAYHLSVPQSFKADSPAVRNAVTLYEMAYSVCSRLEQTTKTSRVIMASLNNLAHINHECGRAKQSRDILQTLQSYIRGLEENKSTSQATTTSKETCKLYSDEKRTYLLNAIFLHKPRGAAAA